MVSTFLQGTKGLRKKGTNWAPATKKQKKKKKRKKICQSSSDRIWSYFPSYPYHYFSPASRLSCSQGLGLLSRAPGHAGAGGWPAARTVPGGKWGSLRRVSPASHSFSWIPFTVLRTGWTKITQLSNCLVGLLLLSILPPLFLFGVQPTGYVDTVEESRGKGHRKACPMSELFSLFTKLCQL